MAQRTMMLRQTTQTDNGVCPTAARGKSSKQQLMESLHSFTKATTTWLLQAHEVRPER